MSHAIPAYEDRTWPLQRNSIETTGPMENFAIAGIGDEREFGVRVVHNNIIRFQAVNRDDFLFPSVSLRI